MKEYLQTKTSPEPGVRIIGKFLELHKYKESKHLPLTGNQPLHLELIKVQQDQKLAKQVFNRQNHHLKNPYQALADLQLRKCPQTQIRTPRLSINKPR